MDIETLREMIVLAEKKNYAKAAEQLYISQSALSRHISAMEEKLQVRLFDRNPRKVSLTAYGEALMPFARKIIEIDDKVVEAIEEVRHREQKSVRVSSVHGLSHYGIMKKITGFISENRDLSFNLTYNSNNELKDMLINGDTDLIISFGSPEEDDKKLKTLKLYEDPLVVVLPDDHPLKDRKQLSIPDLTRDEWIMQEDNRYLTGLIKNLIRGSGAVVNEARLHVAGVGALELVQQGLGIAIEQKQIAEGHKTEGLVFVPLIPETKIIIKMVWKKEISSAGARFADYMKKHVRT